MTARPTVRAPHAARRRPRRPSKATVEDLTHWALYASHEPLWDATSAGRPRRPGRPLRLTPAVALKFLTCVRLGNYRETAAAYAGIGKATMYRWLGSPRPPFVAFRMAVEQAEAQVEVEVVANLMRLSAESTRAAEFWLTHRYPARWRSHRPNRSPITPCIGDGPREMADGIYLIIPREVADGSSTGIGWADSTLGRGALGEEL